MFTWNTYEIEKQRRQDEMKLVLQDRLVRSAKSVCETGFTKLSIRLLDIVGSTLVQWGSSLQCRCAELSLTSSKRAI